MTIESIGGGSRGAAAAGGRVGADVSEVQHVSDDVASYRGNERPSTRWSRMGYRDTRRDIARRRDTARRRLSGDGGDDFFGGVRQVGGGNQSRQLVPGG